MERYSDYDSVLLQETICEPYLKTFTIKDVSFDMLHVEGGTFTMGATTEQHGDAYDWEKPSHKVNITNDYYLGKFVVTQALWVAVMGYNPSHFHGENLPVEQVSWNDCQEFIKKLNNLTGQKFRLPTEAEWEFAARGGNLCQNYKYAGGDNLSDVAWYGENSDNTTHEVGTKPSNELGFYDMSGNVWEWCEDWYGDYSKSPQTNPKGAVSGLYKIHRGGSWSIFRRFCRVSMRGRYYPDFRYYFLGFRLAI